MEEEGQHDGGMDEGGMVDTKKWDSSLEEQSLT